MVVRANKSIARFRGAEALAGALLLAGQVSAQCGYESTLIVAPACGGGGAPYIPNYEGEDMSENGVVVGWYEQCEFTGRTEPFIWTEEIGFAQLQRPPGFNSIDAVGVSANGRYIVGHGGKTGLNQVWSIIWDNGVPTEIPPILNSNDIQAVDVNDDGTVIGTIVLNDVAAFMARRNGNNWQVRVLQLPAGPRANAREITNTNEIVGVMGTFLAMDSWGYRYITESNVLQMPLLPNGLASSGHTLNSNGMVGGGASIFAKGFPFGFSLPVLWGKTLRQAKVWEEGSTGVILDLNDSGTGVGLVDPPSVSRTAALWFDTQVFELTQLAPSPLVERVYEAKAIINDGRILIEGDIDIPNVEEFGIMAILTPIGSVSGDLNTNCIVDIYDLELLLSEWDRSDSLADIDKSGKVDVFDLLILLAGWG